MKQFHVLFPKQKKTIMFSHEVILTNSPDGPIMAYESSTGGVVAQFTGSRSPCRGITMAGNGLIAASHVSPDTGSGSIHLYNWYTPTMFHSLPISEPVAPLAATPDGAFLFAGGISGSVHSISLPSSDIIKSFAAHSRSVSSLHVSDDGSLVISGSDDGTIVVTPTFRLVDEALLQQQQQGPKDSILHQWKAHSNSVTAFNSSIELCSSVLVSCSLDCTCKFWSLSNGTLLRTVEFPCAILGFSMDEDSTESRFYAAGADGLVYKGSRKKMDTENRANYEMVTNTWSKKRHGGSIVSLVLVNGGRNLVSAAEEGSVWMWNEEGEVTMVLGNEYMGRSISDMVVAKCGTSSSSTSGVVRKGIDFATGGGFISSLGLCDEEMIRTLKQIVELGDFMDVAVQDKRRAIDMLESAIAMYERLLRLILKEATKAIEAEEEEGKYEKEDK